MFVWRSSSEKIFETINKRGVQRRIGGLEKNQKLTNGGTFIWCSRVIAVVSMLTYSLRLSCLRLWIFLFIILSRESIFSRFGGNLCPKS